MLIGAPIFECDYCHRVAGLAADENAEDVDLRRKLDRLHWRLGKTVGQLDVCPECVARHLKGRPHVNERPRRAIQLE